MGWEAFRATASPRDPEGAVPDGGLVGHLDVVDPRRGRPAPAPLDHRLDVAVGALERGFEPSSGKVADPAAETSGARFRRAGGAEEDPLDATRHDHPHAAH